jgi:hypothetical protein
MYGAGRSRDEIARVLAPRMKGPEDQRLKNATAYLRKLERIPEFRDLAYDEAVTELDLDTPLILKGLSRKARAGRVDAAKLSLEITGRYTPKGDQAPTQIAIVLNGVPRPSVGSAQPVVVDQEADQEADQEV